MNAGNKGLGIIADRAAETSCRKCNCQIDVAGLDPFDGMVCPDCGSEETVPAKFGQFLLLNLIGRGGMGSVYYALDTSLGRHVAVKVMLQSLGRDAQVVETFKKEAQAIARLNHQNIVQVYAFGKEKGQPYIVMELVEGRRLDKLMAGGKQLDPALVLKIAMDIAEGLKAADEIRLVHGDVKPDNILLDEKGQAKLVDFGLASFANQAAAEGVWGSPYYVAPEKIRCQPVDARSDIYSLGATIYHALAGRPPFDGDTALGVVKARLERDPADLHMFCPKVDRFVESIVMRMLQQQPSRRYPNYASLLGDLRKALQETGPVKTGRQNTTVLRRPTKTRIDPVRLTQSPSVTGNSFSNRLVQNAAVSGRRRFRGVSAALVAGLLIAGAVAMALYSHGRKKEMARKATCERLAIAEWQALAVSSFTVIQLASTNISKMAHAVDVLRAQVTNDVFVVTGELPAMAVAGSEKTAVPETVASEPGIRGLAGRILQVSRVLGEKTVAAASLADFSATLKSEALVAAISGVAVQKSQELAVRLEAIKAIEFDVKQMFAECEQIARKTGTVRADHEAAAYARKKAAEEEANRKAAALAEEKKADDLKSLVAIERRRVEETRRNCLHMVKSCCFKEALEAADSQVATFQTDEGKKDIKVLVDRYTQLLKLKSFLVEQLQAGVFQWGWLSPQQDIIGADQVGVQLKGRTVAWASIGAAQILKIADHCLGNKSIQYKVRAEMALATAIWCFELGGEDAAAKYADRAVEISVSMKDDRDRLLLSRNDSVVAVQGKRGGR